MQLFIDNRRGSPVGAGSPDRAALPPLFAAAKLLLIAVTVAAIFSGCGAEKSPTIPGGETRLVYGSGDYTAINPALFEHGEINPLIFAGLTAHDRENKIVPALAERWEYDENTLTYTFHLKSGAKWSDGSPVTAEDAKFTLEAIMNPANFSEIASNYEDIGSIEAVDERTLKITLTAPNAALLDYLTVGILPKKQDATDINNELYNLHPVGAGPYALSSWETGQRITLTRNAHYEGAPALDMVEFKLVPDDKARAMQLKSGELDLAQISPQDAKLFLDDPDFNVYHMKTSDYRAILYNFKSPLFRDNRELPAAFSYAIDRRVIVDGILLGHGETAYSPLQMGRYNNPDVERYDYDPERAKGLLSDAGWKAGADGILEKNGTRLAFTISCAEGDQTRADMAAVCAQQLREIGVDAKAAVTPQVDWEGQDAYLIGWGSPFDPDDHTYKVFGSGKAENYGSYENAKVDELLKSARSTSDETQRKQYYLDFQRELAADPPYTFLAYADATYVANKSISGIDPDVVLGHHGVGIFWNISDWTKTAAR